jgi:hypothetical protein
MGSSVGIVRSRSQTMEFFFIDCVYILNCAPTIWGEQSSRDITSRGTQIKKKVEYHSATAVETENT